MNEKPRIDEALASYEIVKQLIELGYPHNFQLENKWVVDYLYRISNIIKQAMEIKKAQEVRDKESKQQEVE